LRVLEWHQWSLAGFFGVLLLIAISNFWGIPRLKGRTPRSFPKVSILIPMRNEAFNAEGVISSALSLDYPDYEVLVYEEGSDDGTPEILAGITHPQLRVLKGSPPPLGWLGKNWACYNLAKEASGPLLLFVDADVRLEQDALRAAVAELLEGDYHLVSVLPRQEVGSLGELLLVSIIPWSLASFFPLVLSKMFRAAKIQATVGQFILVRKEAYLRAGGHEAIKGEVLDDFELGWLMRKRGYKLGLLYGGDLVRCRMYRGFKEAFDGLSKNLFLVFRRRLALFAFVWGFLFYSTWEPLCFLVGAGLGAHIPAEVFRASLASFSFSFALWGLTAARFGLPLFLPLVHPIVVAVALATAARSAFWHLTGRGTWKGRSIHVKSAQR